MLNDFGALYGDKFLERGRSGTSGLRRRGEQEEMNSMMNLVNCPVCDHSPLMELDFSSEQQANHFKIAQCRSCSHRFLTDPPSSESLPDFYDSLFADDERSANPVKPGFRDWALVRTLTRRLPRNARILDIGANFGSTLLAFPSSYHLEGVELSLPAAKAAARNPRLKIHNSSIESLSLPPAGFDCILSLAVIEHIPDVVNFLSSIRTLLAPGGVAVLMTGDWRSWHARNMGSRWHLYHSGGHLHFFSSLSLELALSRAGLCVSERLWSGPNPVTSKLPHSIGRAIHCQTTSLTIPFLFARRQLGDHLYVWAEQAS